MAFQYGNDICVMDADGSNLVNLTDSPYWEWYPAWSPDGRKIAFVSNRDGNSDIHVIDVDGSNEKNLTRNNTFENRPN